MWILGKTLERFLRIWYKIYYVKETIKKIITEFHERGLPNLIERDIDKQLLNLPLAKVIVGPRRAGKTYVLFQIMKEMEKKGKSIKDFIYINFEDNRLIDFNYKNFEDIIEGYAELYPSKKPIFFLDEIHNIRGWEFFVRRLVDQKYNVYITGSNAHLLSNEYATKLGGRYVEIQIYPLNFKEFIKFKGIRITKNIFYSHKRFFLLKYFNEYIRWGGFPEVVLLTTSEKEAVLKAYLDSVIYRDIISRYKIQDTKIIELLVKKLAENITNPFSFSSIVKKIKTLGFNTNVKTISSYYSYLLESFFIINATQKKESFLKREMERKAYFIDNGYLSLFYMNKNKDKLLENVIARYTAEKLGQVVYYRNKYEIDFADIPMQVTYELTEDNRKREIDGLLNYMAKTDKKKGIVITYNQENIEEKGGMKIYIIPAYKYLLGYTPFKNMKQK